MPTPTQLLSKRSKASNGQGESGRKAPSRPPGRPGSSKLLRTRRGMIGVAALAALAALALLLVFMASYRDSVRSGGEPVQVLVADQILDKGTPGDVIAESALFRTAEIREDEITDGTFTDVDALRDLHATETIYEGQQLTAANLGPGADPIAGKLSGTDRALAVPLDAAHGNIGQVKPGSTVDVLGGFNAEQTGGRARPVLDVLARDVLVLKTPSGESDGGVSSSRDVEVVLRLSDLEATRVAFAADRGNVWLSIRPPTLAKDSKLNTVDVDSVLGLGAISGEEGR